jgi:hypothetical protein
MENGRSTSAAREEEPVATLDYALLAEYARIDPAGLVTIVGGSFDRVQATSTGGAQQTYVVMRVLLDESEETTSFEVSVEPPNKAYAPQLAGTAIRAGRVATSTGLALKAGCSKSWSPVIGTPAKQSTS